MKGKRLKEYHIESYWAEKAEQEERTRELKEKFRWGMLIGGAVALQAVVMYEFVKQLFEALY